MIDPIWLGAVPLDGTRTRFTVWAPERGRVELALSGPERRVDLPDLGGGYHGAVVGGCPPGSRYHYLLDGEGPLARFRAEGYLVQGP